VPASDVNHLIVSHDKYSRFRYGPISHFDSIGQYQMALIEGVVSLCVRHSVFSCGLWGFGSCQATRWRACIPQHVFTMTMVQ